MPVRNAEPDMKKGKHVAILFNEPTSGNSHPPTEDKLLFSSGGSSSFGRTKVHNRPMKGVDQIDLSELGVVEEMEDLKEALATLGYEATTFNVDRDVFRLIDFLRDNNPDVIFNIVECVDNESIQEMNVAGIYELLKIPYTGASPFALGLALNKARVKEILLYHGIRTPDFQVFKSGEKIALRSGLHFPIIVKPLHEDGSVGISDSSIVNTQSELHARVEFVFREFHQPALAEEYIDGREFNVAILGNTPPVPLPISEIDFGGLTDGMHKIVSYEAKWMEGTVQFHGTNGVCPADLLDSIADELKATALRCYQLIGCRDYARVDFRLSKAGVPYVLEVNPNPDISADAGFARSARAYGLEFPQIVANIIELALERSCN